MSEYLNRITIVGRCGQDPEIRYFESGSVKASISVAVRPPYKSENALWFDLIAWGSTAEVIANYVKKGTQIAIVGEFGFDRWTDKNSGAMRSKPIVTVQTIELLGSPKNEDKSYKEEKQTASIANANY
ncbi:single-stranded DNA-binding protein [Hassallia byssoidea VB512170]|uniref:Single-stranded DNA-binding protein n=2 Tax=Nostocales TaxID=1161 RepID=A0A846HFC3_9CYAN|nr:MULTISPECIES: single-stranded DNA-binding protein [Nostocales]MBD2604113.1 single-stranded DNA-binding protein [Scytonema hofmannii FACHB-248]MBW4567406.1 single-stranded DNA-binding protein [Tolypothrix carrinoi HA7290-LM1]NEU75334.1 single-stranded DNA-binding protein [Hassalia byssoidea VB512170]